MAGTVSRVAATDTAFGRGPPYLIAFESTWTDPRENDANIAWGRNGRDSLSRSKAAASS